MGKEILRRKNEETRAKTEMVSGELCSQKTPAAVKAVERETFFFLILFWSDMGIGMAREKLDYRMRLTLWVRLGYVV